MQEEKKDALERNLDLREGRSNSVYQLFPHRRSGKGETMYPSQRVQGKLGSMNGESKLCCVRKEGRR